MCRAATMSRSSWLTLHFLLWLVQTQSGPIAAEKFCQNFGDFDWTTLFQSMKFHTAHHITSHTRPPPLLTVSGSPFPNVSCVTPPVPTQRRGRGRDHGWGTVHVTRSTRHSGKNRFRGLEKCLAAGMRTLWRTSSVNTADACSIRSIPQQLVKVYATTCNIGPSSRESHCDEWPSNIRQTFIEHSSNIRQTSPSPRSHSCSDCDPLWGETAALQRWHHTECCRRADRDISYTQTPERNLLNRDRDRK